MREDCVFKDVDGVCNFPKSFKTCKLCRTYLPHALNLSESKELIKLVLDRKNSFNVFLISLSALVISIMSLLVSLYKITNKTP